jgi:malate dehydrogenase
MMAAKARITAEGVQADLPSGSPEELAELAESYEHLVGLRSQAIAEGILPPVAEWREVNRHL